MKLIGSMILDLMGWQLGRGFVGGYRVYRLGIEQGTRSRVVFFNRFTGLSFVCSRRRPRRLIRTDAL
jgi:hypothetical protein